MPDPHPPRTAASAQDLSPGLCQASVLLSSLDCNQQPGKVPACFQKLQLALEPARHAFPRHTPWSKAIFSARLQDNRPLCFLMHFQKLQEPKISGPSLSA